MSVLMRNSLWNYEMISLAKLQVIKYLSNHLGNFQYIWMIYGFVRNRHKVRYRITSIGWEPWNYEASVILILKYSGICTNKLILYHKAHMNVKLWQDNITQWAIEITEVTQGYRQYTDMNFQWQIFIYKRKWQQVEGNQLET